MSSLLIAHRDANTCSKPQNSVNIVRWQLEYKNPHDQISHFSCCRNEEREQGVKGRLFHQNSWGRVGLATAFCPQPGPDLLARSPGGCECQQQGSMCLEWPMCNNGISDKSAIWIMSESLCITAKSHPSISLQTSIDNPDNQPVAGLFTY